MELSAYFDDLMRRRPANEGGYINLPKENFKKMVTKAKNEADLKTLVYAHVNYIGHRKILPHAYVDSMLLRALELGHPEVMIDTFRLHTELVYHPSPLVTEKYLEYFADSTYESLKTFYEAIKVNYLLIKPTAFFTTMIDKAYENKDYTTVVDVYLYAFNYDALSAEHLVKVYES